MSETLSLLDVSTARLKWWASNVRRQLAAANGPLDQVKYCHLVELERELRRRGELVELAGEPSLRETT